MHVAHFVPRYPPALGGAEAYVERLSQYLAGCGDTVTVWTSTAVDLEAMWRSGFREIQPNPPAPFPEREGGASGGQVRTITHTHPPGERPACSPSPLREGGRGVRFPASASQLDQATAVRRYRPLHFPARRYLLKLASLIPVPAWQALTLPCNPVCPAMWRDAGRLAGSLDAVHAFTFPHSFVAACGLRLARRRGVPFLLTPFLHLGDPLDPADRTRRQYTSAPLRWLLRQADAVFVQTPSEKDAVERLGVRPERVVLQGLGVDPADCTGGDRTAVRQRWGVGSCTVVVGHLANNSVEKGAVDLLHAVARLPTHVRLVLAGPEMPNFRRAWDRFPHQNRVTRLGVLSDQQKRDFFAGIDVFALPSRTDSFGLVLLEAWANGKPVVCYRAGGPADLVRDGIDGRVLPCGDVVGLAEALSADGPTRSQFGQAGRERLVNFRWADRLAVVRDHLARLTRRPAPAARRAADRPTTVAAAGWP
ncbi:MAG: glycosyltransferase family 4 protein [Gemmataceae bacterium]